jgi:iron complex outermembrane recepter protein
MKRPAMLLDRSAFIHCRTLAATQIVALMSALSAGAAQAQSAPVAAAALDPIVVTATRRAERSFDLPASIDVIDAAQIHDGEPMINLSESLVRVPGVYAANRSNYAQDLQISSRGFGARAAFGVRGVRLYQDNIPVTMPDGQGQTGSFSLLSAQRIEVLRGPFSTLYGNASGGVIAVFTEDAAATPMITANSSAGSYGTWITGVKASGIARGVGYVVAASRFSTDGYRDHSSAQRDLTNVKLSFAAGETTQMTVVASTQYQQDTQDPLGLTRAQWEANPRQVDPSAIQFDTRKTINQSQMGAAIDQQLTDSATLRVTGYGGRRLIRQYLALAGSAATSAGGVADLDRDFAGIDARIIWRGRALDRPLTFSIGTDYDRQHELRRGFVNNNGSMGDLRRDEDDTVASNDVYAEAAWDLLPVLSLTAGVRTSNVRYRSQDHYIAPGNPDDSGARQFSNTSPVLAAVFHVDDRVNVYASYGRGFETPTFAEIAYKPVGTGLNFGLDPATSRALEAGIKARIGRGQSLNLAVFNVDTDDEIVVDAATGGRTSYKNGGRTRRRGAELAWNGSFDRGVSAHVAYTYLRAEFADAFVTGAPPVVVPSGARLPGVPASQAYGELAWAPTGPSGFSTALEVQYAAKVYVNERNSDAAPAYTVGNARVGYALNIGSATLRTYARLNNFTDRHYAGSVIVGDSNGRFFEPAPGRNWMLGFNVDVAL